VQWRKSIYVTGVTRYTTIHTCDKVCALCTATPPCTKDQSKYCCTFNRWFLSEKCFQNHLILKVTGKLVCQWRQVCRNGSYLVTSDSKNECFKKFCTFCNKKHLSGHLCYVAPLKPSKLSNKCLYVFVDTECTQDLEKRDGSFEHVPNLICAQQMCSKCDAVEYVNDDCEQCGKRVHTYWQDSVEIFTDYLRLSRPFSDRIYVISHNSRGYETVFSQKIMDGSKILSMVVENLHSIGFAELFAHEFKEHAQIIRPDMQEGVLPPLLQHVQQCELCGSLSRVRILRGRFYAC